MTIRSALLNALMVVVSIVICFTALELFLWGWSATHVVERKDNGVVIPPPDFGSDFDVPTELVEMAKRRQQLLTMPDSWKLRPTEVPGAASANYWQNVLQVYNVDNMRWAGPIPSKRDDTYRVMVVGDSLTWGAGLDIQWRFSNLLQQWLGKTFNIEFINLGHSGYQSEDIRKVIARYLPTIKPDLLLYAVCLNDFLPSEAGQYSDLTAYPFPLPAAAKTFLIQHTRAGAFLADVYDGALRRLHLRTDFYDDILADFAGYQKRFARDVKDMNHLAISAGLPPMVALVVDQYPSYGGRGYQISQLAEKALAQAGAKVIETENFYRRYHNQAMHVSRWEGHPNEVANYIWASMIAKELQNRPELQAFKRWHALGQ